MFCARKDIGTGCFPWQRARGADSVAWESEIVATEPRASSLPAFLKNFLLEELCLTDAQPLRPVHQARLVFPEFAGIREYPALGRTV
jgi:hypothetical protein